MSWTVYWITVLCNLSFSSCPTAKEIRLNGTASIRKFLSYRKSSSDYDSYLRQIPSKQLPKNGLGIEEYTKSLEKEIDVREGKMLKLNKMLVQTHSSVIDLNEEVNHLVLNNLEFEHKTQNIEQLKQEIEHKYRIIES